jgi:hypothetical protein
MSRSTCVQLGQPAQCGEGVHGADHIVLQLAIALVDALADALLLEISVSPPTMHGLIFDLTW